MLSLLGCFVLTKRQGIGKSIKPWVTRRILIGKDWCWLLHARAKDYRLAKLKSRKINKKGWGGLESHNGLGWKGETQVSQFVNWERGQMRIFLAWVSYLFLLSKSIRSKLDLKTNNKSTAGLVQIPDIMCLLDFINQSSFYRGPWLNTWFCGKTTWPISSTLIAMCLKTWEQYLPLCNRSPFTRRPQFRNSDVTSCYIITSECLSLGFWFADSGNKALNCLYK